MRISENTLIALPNYDDCIEVSNQDEQFEDDGYIHIVRGGNDYIFYRGQENPLTERNIQTYANMIDREISR
jgi:hypothetical protein